MPTYWTAVGSPLGPLMLTADDEGLTGLHMDSGKYGPLAPRVGWVEDAAPFVDVAGQLDEYFAGDRTEFDVPMHPTGTPFQLEVWQALTTIPYGEVRSYGEIAQQLGRPGASRAVGLANGHNPIAVIVPCHRVIGASGSLTGYGGGLERKRLLLDLEAGVAGATLFAGASTSVSRPRGR